MDYILVKNFLSKENINKYFELIQNNIEHDSKVGKYVNRSKKIRKDMFFNEEKSKIIDICVFKKIKEIVYNKYNIELNNRETYKIGTYHGDNKGFYVPHTDTQGNMEHRQISTVICLSNEKDYEGGIFKFIDLDKSFKFDIGDAIIFKSNLLHGVEPITWGKRQVLITFMWNNDNQIVKNLNQNRYNFKSNNRLISFIPANSGPGNQIIGIKECLILSNMLNRVCVIPPIREHYLKSNSIFYNFNDIFKLDLNNIIVDNINYDIINNLTIKNKYVIYSSSKNTKLHNEKLIKNNKINEILLNKRSIINNNCTKELKNVSDETLLIKHLFNNLYINTCGFNGCFICKLNSNFEDTYKKVCSKWDYSDDIKYMANQFIKNLNKKYIAVHLRLPDMMNNSIEKYTNNIYNDIILKNILEKIIKRHNNQKIFIASNNINYVKKFNLNFSYIDTYNKHNSFIEQYICCKSTFFYYLNLENTRFYNKHNRSTWTSFVLDYRKYLLKTYYNYNLRQMS